jgi:lipoprotein-anchoring transpeptidase ErfK/SrfK
MPRLTYFSLRRQSAQSGSTLLLTAALLPLLGGCAFEPYPPLPVPPQPEAVGYAGYSALPMPPEPQGPPPRFASETEDQAADTGTAQPGAEPGAQPGPPSGAKAAAAPVGRGEARVPVQEPAWRGDPAAFVGPPKPGPRKLTIRLKNQRFEYSEGGTVVHAGEVSTGTPEHPTPRGAFSVLSKEENKVSRSYTNYFDMSTPMPYSLQFKGPYFVHEGWVAGQGKAESHGCVRLHYEDARFVYERMRVGDKIAVVD